jgi:lipopolysaccharide export system permease protein
MLNNGQRLETKVDSNELKVSDFQSYGTQITSEPLTGPDTAIINTQTTLTLIQQPTPTALGELSWRLGLLLAAINFVIIGVASSSVNPRVGKSVNLVFSLFTFVIYFNLLNLGQNWIAGGKMSFAGFMLLLHGGVFMLAIFWLAKGHNNWHWRTVFGPRPADSTTSGASA